MLSLWPMWSKTCFCCRLSGSMIPHWSLMGDSCRLHALLLYSSGLWSACASGLICFFFSSVFFPPQSLYTLYCCLPLLYSKSWNTTLLYKMCLTYHHQVMFHMTVLFLYTYLTPASPTKDSQGHCVLLLQCDPSYIPWLQTHCWYEGKHGHLFHPNIHSFCF